MRLLTKYLRPLLSSIVFGMTVKVVATLFELGLPYILSYILDELVPLHRVAPILLGGAAMVVAALMAMIGNVVANRNAAKVARFIRSSLKQTDEKLLHITLMIVSLSFCAFLFIVFSRSVLRPNSSVVVNPLILSR